MFCKISTGVGLVRAGLGAVVQVVRGARLVLGLVALLGRHPQVGRAGVVDDHEFLRGRADADGPVVLAVLQVRQRDAAAALVLRGVRAPGRDPGR